MGIVFYFIVPDNQLNCRWLSERDQLLAIERVRINEQGIGNRNFKWYQLREALLDPAAWAIFLYALVSCIPNGGISNFFSQLIVNFGYTLQQSLLYGIPAGGATIISCLLNGWIGDYFQRRVLVAVFPMAIAALGIILIVALPLSNDVGRLVGYYLAQMFPATSATMISLLASNYAGYTKKTSVAAFYMIGYSAGNIIGPQTFRPQDAPRYLSAEITIFVCFCFCVLDVLFLNWWYQRENRRKAAIRNAPSYTVIENQA